MEIAPPISSNTGAGINSSVTGVESQEHHHRQPSLHGLQSQQPDGSQPPVRRGRGRPRKIPLPSIPNDGSSTAITTTTLSSDYKQTQQQQQQQPKVSRGRGRPRKIRQPEQHSIEQPEKKVRRGRGRPRKIKSSVEDGGIQTPLS